MGTGPVRTRTRVRWAWALVAASLVPAVVFGFLQAGEDRAVDRYLRERGLMGLPANEATALRVSRAVRADFETDSSKWKAYTLAGGRSSGAIPSGFCARERGGVARALASW